MAKQRKTIAHDIFNRPVRNSINSKRKGNENEVLACKWLSVWTGAKFIRTPSSGGRRLTNNDSFCGDVVCEDQAFEFCFVVETKHYQQIGFVAELKANSKVFKFWDQGKADATRAGKETMLMLRENKMLKGSYIIFVSRKLAVFLLSEGLEALSKGRTEKGELIIGFKSEAVVEVPYNHILAFYKKCA